jgi:hypothetical protein
MAGRQITQHSAEHSGRADGPLPNTPVPIVTARPATALARCPLLSQTTNVKTCCLNMLRRVPARAGGLPPARGASGRVERAKSAKACHVATRPTRRAGRFASLKHGMCVRAQREL